MFGYDHEWGKLSGTKHSSELKRNGYRKMKNRCSLWGTNMRLRHGYMWYCRATQRCKVELKPF